jgi:membrane-associated phospholipid phosphatase
MSEHAYTAGALPRSRSVGRARRSGAGNALLLSALCVAALALLWAVAELIPAVQVRDAVALHDFTLLDGPHIGAAARELLHLLNPRLFTIWALALVLFALARNRPRIAFAVAVVMSLAPLSAEVLKPLLAHAHVQSSGVFIGSASWPSGHATAATALALSAVLVAPPRMRFAVAMLAVAFILAVGTALLIRAWHLPSDVLGGFLLGTLWITLAVAALRAAERRWPSRGAGADGRGALA